MAARREKSRLWTRLAIGLGALVVLLSASLITLRWWITTDGGRGLIMSLVNGRSIGPMGSILIEGLDGDPLGDLHADSIAFVDEDGVWLRAHDANLSWRPQRLLSGELSIASLVVAKADMLRRPKPAARPSSGGGSFDMAVRLEKAQLDELRLLDGVIGPPASYRIAGDFIRTKDMSGRAGLNIAPLNGPADELALNADWSTTGVIQASLTAKGPEGGLLAILLQSPAETPVALTAEASGTLRSLTAKLDLTFADESAAHFDMERMGETARFEATIAADRWPLLHPLAQRTGGTLEVSGDATFANDTQGQASLSVKAPAGVVELSAPLDFDKPLSETPIRAAVHGYDLSYLAPAPHRGTLEAAGDVRIASAGDWSFVGEATVADLVFPSGSAAAVSGPVSVVYADRSIVWATPGAEAKGARIEALTRLAREDMRISHRGRYRFGAGQVDIEQAKVAGSFGEVTARGDYRVQDGRLDLSGAADITDLSKAAPLSGAMNGRWSVSRARSSASFRITVDAQGRNVADGGSALAQVLGEEPQLKAALLVRGSRVAIESGSLEGGAARLRVTGETSAGGQVSARLRGDLVRPVNLGGVRVDTAELSGEADGPFSDIAVKLELRDTSGALAGRPLSIDAATFDGRLADALSGRLTAAGKFDGADLSASARLSGDSSAPALVDLSASLAGLRFAAPRLSFANGVAMDGTLTGSLAGLYGVERGDIGASAHLGAQDGLRIRGDVRNLVRSGVRLARVSVSVASADDAFNLDGRITGADARGLNLAFAVGGDRHDGEMQGTARLAGVAAGARAQTPEPINWRLGDQGWSVQGAITALGGRLDGDVRQSGRNADATLTLSDLDLQAVTRLAQTPPYVGKVSGSVRYANNGVDSTGTLSLDLKDANPQGLTGDAVSTEIRGELRNGQVTLSAHGGGQGFRLDASGSGAVLPGDGFALTPDQEAPVQAKVSVDGGVEQIWAVFGPSDQSLRGDLKADLSATGRLKSLSILGDFAVENGVYDHGETGLHLQDISVGGDFSDRSLRITKMNGADGEGGRLSGDGEIFWNGHISGGVDFAANDLRALNRDDRFAVVSGTGGLKIDPDAIRITGEMAVTQARISVEQPASARIPTLPLVRKENFPIGSNGQSRSRTPQRPVRLDLTVKAPRRIVVFGRGLDTEWGGTVKVTGPVADPIVQGDVRLVRGDVSLAGRRFVFNSGTVTLDGPIRTARFDIVAERNAAEVDAELPLTGTPVDPSFVLESTPSLPQDEILARVLFNRSTSELSGLEAAQLAAALTELAGGQAAFNPADLLRGAAGLDRLSIGAEGDAATVAAGKYIADNVYLELGAGGEGGVGAEVEWEPTDDVSVISSAKGNGDTRIVVRWKKDY
ncbi:MAG: translocation/assembly module TamB domain-containing protein [Hyphomonadaceae bacterium]